MLIKDNNEIFKKSMYDLNFMWDDIKVKAKLEVETLVDLFNKYKQKKWMYKHPNFYLSISKLKSLNVYIYCSSVSSILR